MKIMKKLYADGRVQDCDISMSLTEMQEFVGGYIQIVSSTMGKCVLVVNEEGAIKNLPYNEVATALVMPGTLMVGGLRGDVLLARREGE